jgi:integrase
MSDSNATRQPLTIQALVNHFLKSKHNQVASKELKQGTYEDYRQDCQRVIDEFGAERRVSDLTPSDFEDFRAKLARRFGLETLKVIINRIRTLFKYGFDQDLLPVPVRYGQGFKPPSQKAQRLARAAKGVQSFEPQEIHALLKETAAMEAEAQLRAMILLGVNCGFGNTDVGELPLDALRNLDSGWVDFPRPKTGVRRRCPLWPETIEAIKKARARRREPKHREHDGLLFLTPEGNAWVREQRDAVSDRFKKRNAVSDYFTNLTARARVRNLGFLSLRRTFETIGSETGDDPAVSAIMGHVPKTGDMASLYRQRITDARLRKVANHVHEWLFGS